MGQPVGGHELVALREEIQRVGDDTRWVRGGLGGCSLILVFSLLALGWTIGYHIGSPEPFYWRALPSYLSFEIAVAGTSLSVLLALVGARCFRWTARNRLRRNLERLSPEAKMQVLLPLRSVGPGDARKIVRELIGDLRVPTELSSARSPGVPQSELAPSSQEQA